MTQEERIQTVANMLFVNRYAAMHGEESPFNNEAMLIMLIGPEWFVKCSGGQNLDQLLPKQATVEQLWKAVQKDIDRMFPNNFDWENQRNTKRQEAGSGV